MKLYLVRFEKIFERLYVEAKSFQEAEEKVIKHLKDNMSDKYKVQEDGKIYCVKKDDESRERVGWISEIEIMSEFIIK